MRSLTEASVSAASYNPFAGITPSLGPFQPIIGSKIGIFIALVWALGFVYAGYHLVAGIARAANAKQGGYADVLDNARKEMLFAAGALIGLAAVPVIFTTLTA